MCCAPPRRGASSGPVTHSLSISTCRSSFPAPRPRRARQPATASHVRGRVRFAGLFSSAVEQAQQHYDRADAPNYPLISTSRAAADMTIEFGPDHAVRAVIPAL